jgi:ribose-phosphate pyrophosphokinase
MTAVVFGFPGHERLAEVIARQTQGELGTLFLHRFPDGEMYLRLDTAIEGREALFVCSLDRPDAKVLPLLFALDAARDLGAVLVGLVAPYLAYLRQDTRFKPGEAVTSATFAKAMSAAADWIVTVDPHLHRYHALGAVYSIPDRVVHAAPSIAAWIAANVSQPLLVGPDGESEQWVAQVAAGADAPYVVLEKTRRGDRDVEVSIPQIDRYQHHTPVLVDDIVSTARTMIAAVGMLRRSDLAAPVCVGVHGLFADQAYAELQAAGAGRIVTCNTVPHVSNAIDLDAAIAAQVHEFLT